MPEDCLNLGHYNLLKYSETLPTGILAELENEEMQKFGFCS